MNIIVNSDRTVEKEYTEKDGSQNENRVTELNFTLPEEYSGEGFVPKIAFITEDGNFSDYIDNGKYILKNNITKYREVICFVWLTDSVNNIDFRSQTFSLEFYYNEDPSDYIPSEQEKSQIELLMEELEEKIQEVTELEENVYTKDETYSKEEVDEIIPTDISDLNNDSGFIDKDVNNLTNYYKKSETYTKQEIDNKVSSVYKYKGTVPTYNDLPTTGLVVGDVYNVESDGSNYAWNGTAWDKLGGDIDLSGYYTKNETDTLLGAKQNTINSSHKLDADLVDDSNSTNKFTNTTEKNNWNAKYTKPSGGIPKTDLSNEVQASLGKADTALQEHQDISGKEDKLNKTDTIDENSTEDEYPNAEAVYTELVKRDEEISSLKSKNAQLLADHPDIEETGTDLTLEGTGDLPMEVDVGGNSTQIQYSGKNMLNAEAETFTVDAGATEYPFVGLIELVANQQYYISYNVDNNSSSNTRSTPTIRINDNSLPAEYESPTTNHNLTVGRKTWIYTPTVSGLYRLTYWVQDNNVALTVSKFMVSTSSDITYEPFVGNQASPNPTYKQDINNVEGDVEVKAKSKDLFDGVWELGNIDGTTGQNVVNTSVMRCKNYIPVEELTNYKISTDNTSLTMFYIYEYKEDFSYNLETNKGINLVDYFTTNANTKYIRIRPANFTPDLTLKVQLEKGSTATPYVPHQENTVTFPLQEGQKLMLGDTLEDDGVHHKRKQVILDGSEDSWYENSPTRGAFQVNLDNVFYNITEVSVMSNYFEGTTGQLIFNNNVDNKICAFSNNRIYIRYNAFANDLAGFKTWLSTHNVIVEYELAEETIDPYTEEQQTAYNKLKEMQSYYDLTYVVGSSDNAQPILIAKAKKSLKVMQSEIDNINSRLALLE